MLELRPNCELCDKDLPAQTTEACICTYECTFFRHCVDEILDNVCPNCGGGFCDRPIRPQTARRANVSVQHQRVSEKRVHSAYTIQQIKEFSKLVKDIAVDKR